MPVSEIENRMGRLRIDKVRDTLKEHALNSVLIHNAADIFYITGAKTNGILLIKSKEALLYVPAVDYEEIRNDVMRGVEYKMMTSPVPWGDIVHYLDGTKPAISLYGITHTFFKEVIKHLPGIKEVADMVSRHRMIKEHEEIFFIKKACGLASKAIDKFVAADWTGSTEAELAGHLEAVSWKYGGHGCAFPPIVAAGNNSAHPHHVPTEDKINRGWLIIDYGIVYENYCSDLTRTYILDKFIGDSETGKVYKSEDLLFFLTDVKERAARMLLPGNDCSNYYEAVRIFLEKEGLGQYFIHGLGHGVGIEIHERPYFNSSEKMNIEKGMVVTIEPGFYMPGVGGMRLEDTYLVTDNGGELLTRTYR